jgi:hypothetical protein
VSHASVLLLLLPCLFFPRGQRVSDESFLESTISCLTFPLRLYRRYKKEDISYILYSFSLKIFPRRTNRFDSILLIESWDRIKIQQVKKMVVTTTSSQPDATLNSTFAYRYVRVAVSRSHFSFFSNFSLFFC